MSHFISVYNILHFLGSISLDFILDESIVLSMKLSFLSAGVVNICSLVNANFDNFIDICMQYNIDSDISGIDIESGFQCFRN